MRPIKPRTALVLTSFCIADIRGGLGPYLSTWLAGVAGWNPLAIGWLNMATTLVLLLFSGPAGALVDAVGRPRRLIVLACLAILAGSLAVLPLRTFWPVLATQIIVFLGGALATPALLALTLGVVGKQAFARQFGLNQAADHGGNMAAALAVTMLSLIIGTAAPFVTLAITALAAIVFTLAIPPSAIDEARARGTREALGPSKSALAVLRDRRVLTVAMAITLFDLGNDQILPLLGQRLASGGDRDPIVWMAVWILVAQMTMVPMSLVGARLAGRGNAVTLLLVSCAVLALRAVLAALTSGPWWVIAIEVLDGVGAGLISVAGPIAITDLTYGSGHTQTAIGGVGALRGLAAAVSAIVGGVVANEAGWTAALAIMAVPPIAALPLLIALMRRSGS
ncbi:MAG TPA: MFS transporter [Acetobacteraceae bacterium]|nr:MFS transporter [Acetobacteraceae bacterium]